MLCYCVLSYLPPFQYKPAAVREGFLRFLGVTGPKVGCVDQ